MSNLLFSLFFPLHNHQIPASGSNFEEAQKSLHQGAEELSVAANVMMDVAKMSPTQLASLCFNYKDHFNCLVASGNDILGHSKVSCVSLVSLQLQVVSTFLSQLIYLGTD